MNRATVGLLGIVQEYLAAGTLPPEPPREKAPKPVNDGEVPDKTIVRRGNRQMKLMKAVMSGGFVYRPTKSESGRK